MYGYSWIQWVFLFYFYSFVGWCVESAYVSFKEKKFVNRGFIRGPFLPLYGSGGLMMLIVSMPFQENLLLTYVAGCVGATALEYVTGVTMEALFKVRYWDYSKNKFNFQGQICLGSTLAWGALTVLMTRVIHPPVERFLFWVPQGILTLVTMLLTLYFVADFALSFRAALDLRDVLVRMEQARKDLDRLQKRLDVIIALADEAKDNYVRERQEDLSDALEGFAERYGDLAEGIEARFRKIRELLPGSQRLLEKREELLDLRKRFLRNTDRTELSRFISDMMKRGMILGNPTMYSNRFAEALDEIRRSAREYVEERKKKRDGK